MTLGISTITNRLTHTGRRSDTLLTFERQLPKRYLTAQKVKVRHLGKDIVEFELHFAARRLARLGCQRMERKRSTEVMCWR